MHELKHASDDAAAAATGTIRRESTLRLEVAAYVAGARYELEQLARKPAGKDRAKDVGLLAADWNPKKAVAAIVACRTDPKSAPGKWIEVKGGPLVKVVEEVFAAITDAEVKSQAALLKDPFDDVLTQFDGEVMGGGAIHPTDRSELDSLAGESFVDTVSRR